MPTMELDIVLRDGETFEQAVADVIGPKYKDVVTATQVESGNCHPGALLTGPEEALRRVRQRYMTLGVPRPYLRGKAPVGKGQRRV